MTLLTTEIHNHDDPEHAVIVFAADHRISLGRKPHDARKKIFRIQGLKAGIGYFGLAVVPAGNNPNIPMAEWLRDFILNNNKPWPDLNTFASTLKEELNRIIPYPLKQSQISGFHIAGFNSSDLPEFWFVRNVDDDRFTLIGEYRRAIIISKILPPH